MYSAVDRQGPRESKRGISDIELELELEIMGLKAKDNKLNIAVLTGGVGTERQISL